jgi:hypothetical protein
MGHWGIYLSDHSGAVCALDIRGTDLYQRHYQLQEHGYLYFNNQPLLKDAKSNKLQPYGHHEQCQMRHTHIQKRINENNVGSLLHDFETLTSLRPQENQWDLAPVTISSIQAIGFNSKKQQAVQLLGEAPKCVERNDLILWNNLFSEPTQEKIDSDFKHEETPFYRGHQFWAKSQSLFDLGNIEEAYHFLQLAIDAFDGHPEQYITQFYFLIWQYIYYENDKELPYFYDGLRELSQKLPPYLEDHRLLFISRLQKLMGFPMEDLTLKIKNNELKAVFKNERDLRPITTKLMRKLIYPRMEILDIIYLYSQYK